jgi:hypothetical protein
MPTSIPVKPCKGNDYFLLFVVLLAAAFMGVEVIDPAPVTADAAIVASP